MSGSSEVRQRLAALTVPGDLYQREGDRLRCLACGHRCLIGEGKEGICRVRSVRDGVLRVPSGYVAALNADPVEKKPFFHFLPGSVALSFGMLGCDYKCPYCQNWEISQTLRDDDSDSYARPREMTAEEIVLAAVSAGAAMVTSTYNEPLITTEWAVEVFRVARRHRLHTSFVSNGNATPEVVAFLRPWLDAYKVDLKGMREEVYRQMGGRLATVLDSISLLVQSGLWVEVVTLVVPGLNDSEEEIREAARFLAGVSQDLPWHLTAFHDDYRMQGRGTTRPSSLARAAEIGKEEGLRFVYAGNAPGRLPGAESTRCPGCGLMLVERHGFSVLLNVLDASGACPGCGRAIPGVWAAGARPVPPARPGEKLTASSVLA